MRSPFGLRSGISRWHELASGGFSPAVLFANSEPGVWYDPNDIATLFQDAAGTTPVTTPGQTVGLLLDKSGNGFHATQASTSFRPRYGIVPEGGRRNVLLNTDTLATQSVTVAAVEHTLSFTGTGTITLSGASTAGPLVGTGAGNRVSLTFTPTAGSLTMTVAGSVTLAQLEVGSTATAYQRVSTAFDVTEAGVPSLGYLSFDGVDDGMVTPTITPGIDKAQVFAGVRKLAAGGVISPVVMNGDVGTTFNSFAVYAPHNNVQRQFAWSIRTAGQSFLCVDNRPAFLEPLPHVNQCSFNLAGANSLFQIIPRVNGAPQTTFSVNLSFAPTGDNFRTDTLRIGFQAGTSDNFNGHIHQLITRFGANLDTAQIESTEAYVASKSPELVAASKVTWNASTDTYTQNLVGLGR